MLDFCTDYGSDAYVAALETTVREDEDANLCRIYEVGRRREADEEEEEQVEIYFLPVKDGADISVCKPTCIFWAFYFSNIKYKTHKNSVGPISCEAKILSRRA